MFTSFQNLYQHIKKSDPRLFEVLDRISTYLQNFSNSIDNLSDLSVTRTIPVNTYGTVYLNSNNTSRLVSVSVNFTGLAQAIHVLSSNTNPPTIDIGNVTSIAAGGQVVNLTFLVLPNNYYKLVATGAVAVSNWVEFQLG